MLRRVLARAIPLSTSAASGFPKRLGPLHLKASRLCSSPRDPVADGCGSDEYDPFSFPDQHQHQQQLPPDVTRAVDAVVAAAEAEPSPAGAARARELLEPCGAEASEPLVVAALARLRNSCAAAHAAFRSATVQPGYAPWRRACHSMLAILAKHRRFDAARALLDEMRRSSTASPAAVLLLIRRHCAARDVAGAVAMFRALPTFGFHPGVAEFNRLLSALCRYKNVQDVEHLLLSSEKEFPFETKSFNIVLNGWCNIVCSVREAKRF